MNNYAVAIIGAGPIGIELAISLKINHISFVQFDKGQVAQMIDNFPPQTQFFSSNERIGIAGIPVQTVNQQKCTREAYLAYIRSVVLHYQLKINTYEEVIDIQSNPKGYLLHTRSQGLEKFYQVQFLVLATGSTSYPRKLGIPGEFLSHVDRKMEDPHRYFQKNVCIIGGKNSAVETALRCYHAGAFVTMVVAADKFDEKSIKYWLLPELLSRIQKKEMTCYYSSKVQRITEDSIELRTEQMTQQIRADFVIKAIGFDADMSLCEMVGVPLLGEERKPEYDEITMETPVKDVYILGTLAGGTQKKYSFFIENAHNHVNKILFSLYKKLNLRSKPIQISENTYTPTRSLEE